MLARWRYQVERLWRKPITDERFLLKRPDRIIRRTIYNRWSGDIAGSRGLPQIDRRSIMNLPEDARADWEAALWRTPRPPQKRRWRVDKLKSVSAAAKAAYLKG